MCFLQPFRIQPEGFLLGFSLQKFLSRWTWTEDCNWRAKKNTTMMITIIIRWLAWSLNCVQASTIPELTRCQPPKEDRGPYSINSMTGTKLNQVGYVVMKNWSWQRRQKTAIGKLSGKTLSELTYRQKSRRNQSINWLKSLNWINFINQTKQPVEIVDFLKRWISFLQKLQGRGYTRHPLASSRTVRDDNWVKTTSDWIEFWSCSGKGESTWRWVDYIRLTEVIM